MRPTKAKMATRQLTFLLQQELLLFYFLSMLSFSLLHSSLQQSFTSVTAISGCGWNTHPHMEEVGVGWAWSLWRRGFGFATPQTAIRRNRSMLADEEHHSISCNATGFLEAFWNKYFLSKSSDFQPCLSKKATFCPGTDINITTIYICIKQ